MKSVDNIELKRVSDLNPYEKNSRVHSEEQIEQLVDSIKTWGWTIPILIDEENTVIAGHARLSAGQKLEYDEIPCIIAKGWTEQQKKAYVIADNKLAENSNWDMGIFYQELKSLTEEGFDLKLVGIDENFQLDFTNDYTPSINFGEVTEDDIYKAQENQQQLGNQEVHTQTVYCPKCMHEFEISGNN